MYKEEDNDKMEKNSNNLTNHITVIVLSVSTPRETENKGLTRNSTNIKG